MCEYCEKNKHFKAEEKGDGILTMQMNFHLLFGFDESDGGIAHIKNGMLFVDNSSGEYSELGFKINFCPNCGAKMDGGEDNEK